MSSGLTAESVPATANHARNRKYIVLLGLPIGRPQIIAGCLLLALLGQGLWLALHTPVSPMELAQIDQGRQLLTERVVVNQAMRSPLVAAVAALPLLGSSVQTADSAGFGFASTPRSWRWRARLPFFVIALLLGSSLWYVARRLYGNAGGYIALTLYAFAPAMVMRAATVQPVIVAAWGTFGAVFTAIAVAHTLYAPREVVLWNWRRILLLGVALALAVGAQWALAITVVLALAFMLYLAPHRRGAALLILAAACAVALVLLLAAYGFQPSAMAAGVRGARFSEFAPRLFATRMTWGLLALFFLRMPGVLVLLLAALAGYVLWHRPRYFGVTAPLQIWILIMAMGIALPHLGGYNFLVVALPFAFVFIAGVFVDLLETRYSGLVLGVLAGVLAAHAIYGVMGLARIR